MDGQVQLVASTFEFHGKVRTEATASQMTTGWKSLLVKPFDGLLKKNGAGMEIPIKVTGRGRLMICGWIIRMTREAPPGLTSRPK